MINFVQPANVVFLTAPRALKSGDGFVVGKVFAIATVDAASGAVTQGMVEGAVELACTAGATPAVGAAVLFDETTQKVVATGGKSIGVAIGTPPGYTLATSVAWVKLIPTAV